MRVVRIFMAVLFGALIYQVAVVYAGGLLAAVAIPKAYFAYFGRPNL